MPAYLKPLDDGRPVLLDKPILFVGRHPECDIILLNSRKVSRKHCCIAQINNTFRVRDLGSTNGITVNGTRVEREAEVKIGDEVIFGDVRYQLLSGKAPEEGKSKDDAQTASQAPNRAPPTVPHQAESLELSQEYPVIIDEDEDEDIESDSVSQVRTQSKSTSDSDSPAPKRKFDEDSDADVMILDESDYYFEEDDEQD